MGCQRLIVLTTVLLFAYKDYGVSAQYVNVLECVPQPTAAYATPVVQSCGQILLPAIIQPITSGYENYAPGPAPNYSNNGNYPAPYQGYPTIIVEESNNIWQQLLYFMIFATQNKRTNYNMPPSCGCGCKCGCCCSSGCGCSCGCSNCNKNKSNDDNITNPTPTYIPIPFAVPIFTGYDGCPYFDGTSDYSDENSIIIQAPYLDPANGKDQGISLVIRAE